MKQSYQQKTMTYKRLIRNLRLQITKGVVYVDKQAVDNKKDNNN